MTAQEIREQMAMIKDKIAKAHEADDLPRVRELLDDESRMRTLLGRAVKIERTAPEAPAKSGYQSRVKIKAGTVAVGDSIDGQTVTGLGCVWTETVSDEDSSAWGLQPGADYRIKVQYAYAGGQG